MIKITDQKYYQLFPRNIKYYQQCLPLLSMSTFIWTYTIPIADSLDSIENNWGLDNWVFTSYLCINYSYLNKIWLETLH